MNLRVIVFLEFVFDREAMRFAEAGDYIQDVPLKSGQIMYTEKASREDLVVDPATTRATECGHCDVHWQVDDDSQQLIVPSFIRLYYMISGLFVVAGGHVCSIRRSFARRKVDEPRPYWCSGAYALMVQIFKHLPFGYEEGLYNCSVAQRSL
jgi:hypothetical protein